jgi:hypothetical protein
MARDAVLVSLTAALVSPELCTMERPDRAVVAEVMSAPRRSSGEDGTGGPRGRGHGSSLTVGISDARWR